MLGFEEKIMSYRKDFLKLSIGKQRVSFMLSDKERQEICKELKKQAKGIIPQPIHNLTLNGYFHIVKEAILALCDEKGCLHSIWNPDETPTNIIDMTDLDVAKRFMDGRSLFHSSYGDPCGILADIDHNDPIQFKWWKLQANYGGHPWENRMCEIHPFPIIKHEYNQTEFLTRQENRSQYYTDDWLLYIPTYHRNDTYALRSFLHLRRKNIPVIFVINPEQDKKLLSKRYCPDLSTQPNWFSLSDKFFQMDKRETYIRTTIE